MALIKFRSRSNRLNFSELFFPARPSRLKRRSQKLAKSPIKRTKIGPASVSNIAYVRWLKHESMLNSANKLATQYSGYGAMWRNPYGRPRPRAAVKQASNWFTAYPFSLITRPNESFLATMADNKLWQTLEDIGIAAIHTGPMKLAGGIKGWATTPTIDGHFDRISNKLDPIFGTEEEFSRLSRVAGRHGGIVIDDVIPGHTGK